MGSNQQIKLSSLHEIRNIEKPVNIDKYLEWFSQYIEEFNYSRSEKYYQSVMNTVEKKFYSSSFWNDLISNWELMNQEYLSKTGFYLFAGSLDKVYIKPYVSVIDKSYRKNILNNDKWPSSPEKGWVYPQNPFESLNDLLRTTIVVKYLDGAEFVLGKIKEFAEKNNFDFRFDYEAKDKGYYAIHAYIKSEFEVESFDWDTRKIHVSIEIQITTQIQDTIKKLTHEYYEKHRSIKSNDKMAWQWNYKSDDFTLNYLGHILHYLEGMIMEIRDKKEEIND